MKKRHAIPVAAIGLFFVISQYLVPPSQTQKDPPATLILGGDVMLGRTVMTTSLEGKDPTYPFANIAQILKSADIAFVNLENPVTDACKPDLTGRSMVFCAKPMMLDGLVYAGVDVVNLANNHTLNYGRAGFGETKQHLNEAGISYVGDNNLVVKKVGEASFGFIGFDKSQQANPKLTEQERALVNKSNSEVGVLVVAMHWGVEYKDTALPGVAKLAHELVDLGADVVVGHHPHWVQNIEYYNGVPIYYSLGNLVFDQMWSEKTRNGLLVRLTFEDDKIIQEELINTYMENWAQPGVIQRQSL